MDGSVYRANMHFITIVILFKVNSARDIKQKVYICYPYPKFNY